MLFSLLLFQAGSIYSMQDNNKQSSILVFIDSSHPKYRFTYCVYGNTIFLQQCVFPGYSEPIQYSCSYTSDVLTRIRNIANIPENLRPPFKPEQVQFAQIISNKLKNDNKVKVETKYYLKSTLFAKMLIELRKSVQKEEHTTKKLPLIIKKNDVLSRFFVTTATITQ
jgi:hypothetical protein